jgi:hypothetical protein
MDQRVARLCVTVALSLGLSAAVPTPAAAQIAGLPVNFSPSAQPGLRLFGDFAYGGDPGQSYWGGRALLNLSYVSLGFAAGDRGAARAAWGTTLELNLLRGASQPVSVSVLAGYGDNRLGENGAALDLTDIPLGVGVALEVTQPGFDIEPWAGLRAHVRRSDLPGLDAETNLGIGISAGVNARTAALTKLGIPLPGLGAHLSLDYLTVPRAYVAGSDKSLILNVGLNYLLELKSLPPYGIFGGECDPTDPSC